ncbi:MAG: ParB/RepB/Spo0J family partition protein [Spirochaetales bacterium]|nr:ParB/RepB/Spo0J family partition protein [Spirochaetales bacterium]
MSKKALGKGIGALFTEIEEKTDSSPMRTVSIDALKPNPYQPRKEFPEEGLNELADSIKTNGIIQPIIAEDEGDGTYIIIAGERRARAARLAGLSEVPVKIGKFTKEEKIEVALIENIHREDLNPLEEAQAYKNLMDTMELNQEEVAQKVSKKRSTVANALRLLNLPEEVKSRLLSNEITAGHARAILAVLNPADQNLLLKMIVEKNLSVRDAEVYAQEINKGNKSLKKKDKKKASDHRIAPELKEIEQKLIDKLGTKVEIKGNTKTGRIEIHYFSLEDIERLLDILI